MEHPNALNEEMSTDDALMHTADQRVQAADPPDLLRRRQAMGHHFSAFDLSYGLAKKSEGFLPPSPTRGYEQSSMPVYGTVPTHGGKTSLNTVDFLHTTNVPDTRTADGKAIHGKRVLLQATLAELFEEHWIPDGSESDQRTEDARRDFSKRILLALGYPVNDEATAH